MEKSRVEHILEYGLGEASTLPLPKSRVEELLIELINNRGSSDTKIVSIGGRVDTISELPAAASEGTLYFVGYSTDSNKAEYIMTSSGDWEMLGYQTLVVDSEISSSSLNPVENRAIYSELIKKLDSVDAVGKRTTYGEIFNDYDGNKATAAYSHAEGYYTKASSPFQHVQGRYNIENSDSSYAFIIGNGNDEQTRSNAFAIDWNGLVYVGNSGAGIDLSSLHNYDDTAILTSLDTKVDKVTGKQLSTEDYTTAEKTKLSGIEESATAVGKNLTGTSVTVDGAGYTAGTNAEVFNGGATNNKAVGNYSHAEGGGTAAIGACSHTEGDTTRARGICGHAEGLATSAYADYSHAAGRGTTAASECQTVCGRFNTVDDQATYAFIIGNGTGATVSNRKNAFAIDWNGLIYVNGSATGVDISVLAASVGNINTVLESVLGGGE